MALYHEDIIDIELTSGSIHRSWLNHTIGLGDTKANHFGVRLFRDGEPVNAESSDCQGFFMAPNGTNLQIEGSTYTATSGNVAYVTLPQNCYAYEGQFVLAIKLVGGGVTGTMRIIDGMVCNTGTTGAVAPTSEVPTSQEIIAAYNSAVSVIGGSVRFDITQSLTDAQKKKAQENIDAASTADVDDLKSAFNSLLDDKNLFNPSTAVDGVRLSQTGTTVTAPDYFVSAYIPVIAGETYIKNSPSEDGYHRLCVFDSTKTFITGAAYNNNTITIPAGGAFVEFCGEISEKSTTTFILITAQDAQARKDIFDLGREVDELSAKKMDKPKEYTAINGTVHTGVLWNYSSGAESTGKDAYQYAVVTSGFTPGIKYAFDGYQPSGTTTFAAIAFYASGNTLIDTVVLDASSAMEKYETVVPPNTASIYISGMNAHDNAKMYSIGYTDIDLSGIVLENEYAATNWMDRRYQDGEFESYNRKTADHLIVTFSVDDSHADISDIATAFYNANVPLCLATIPEYLENVCNNGDTVLEVCMAVQNHGGEILTHNISPLGASSTPEKYKKYFVTSKKTLTDAGLIVNGIIKAGGTEPGGAPSVPTMLRYLRSYYDYATGFSTVGDGRYTIGRAQLKADTDFAAIKEQIDDAVGGGYFNFFTHGQTDFPNDNTWLSKIMDLVSYIKGKTNAEIVTIGNMYRANFVKSFKT